FTGGSDGSHPGMGVIFDAAGNLYGTTRDGGAYGDGVVFELTPNSNGTWTESVLHSFSGGKDGSNPVGALIFDQAGNLYGATYSGGAHGDGTIFKLTPASGGKWTKDVIHEFKGEKGGDGSQPYAGVVFDTAGNLYGTTYDGGAGSCDYQGDGCGTVFELMPNSKGGWTEQILHRFNSYAASSPVGAVLLDAAGNLYAATSNEAHNVRGTVFEITP